MMTKVAHLIFTLSPGAAMWLPVSITVAVVLAITALAYSLWPRRKHLQPAQIQRARKLFHLRREMLEAKFITLAGSTGKPRGLIWSDCDFDDDVVLARERTGHGLKALVSVTIQFEAIEGGGMEHNPNVANLRAATAVFQFDGQEWTTAGQTVFNLDPVQTVRRFEHELELVE
jgi:hypothetical protein